MNWKSDENQIERQILGTGLANRLGVYPFQTITIHYILHPKYDTLCTKVSADRDSNHIRA